MPVWSRGVSQLCASLRPALLSQGRGRAAATAPAATLAHAVAAMPRLLCTASSVQSSFDIDSIEVAKAAHARQQLVRRCPQQLFRLKGVTFDDRQEVIKKLKPGESLMFWQEPSNPADPGAVHVRTMKGESVGYVARDLKDAFPLPVTFGTVVSAGAAKDTDKWGVSAACRSSLRGIVLTVFSPFPGAEDLKDWSFEKSTAKERALEEYTDMQQVFGKSAWQQLQQQALRRYQHRCAVTGVPASEVPLSVVPQWRLDYHQKTIQLSELIPVCGPAEYLQQLVHRNHDIFDLHPGQTLAVAIKVEATVVLPTGKARRGVDLWTAIMGGGRQYQYDMYEYLEHAWWQVQDKMRGWRLVPHATEKWLAGLDKE